MMKVPAMTTASIRVAWACCGIAWACLAASAVTGNSIFAALEVSFTLLAILISFAGMWVTSRAAKVVASAPTEEDGADVVGTILDAVPGLFKSYTCPIKLCARYGGSPTFLSSLVIHLNDHHRWSREEIADWLESLDVDLSFRVPLDGYTHNAE